MAYTAVFAALHVADLDASRAWYERFCGRPPDLVPNDDEAAWQCTETGWIYVVRDAARAGASAVTLLVDDLDARLAGLAERGIEPGEIETYANGVRHVVVRDPEGNTVAFGEVPSGAGA
ncbi:MAG TPA: VOC family protein [Gaiellales bacterium]|jgi:catechol 2,3-dioxygenase-like lactoylglutathione lyase family enzyme